MTTENNESIIEALKVELAGARREPVDKVHEKAVMAELDRLTGKKVEKALAPKTTETRAK